MTELKTKRFFTCPNGCEHEFEVEHLLTKDDPWAAKPGTKRMAGPWYCSDCGDSWNIEYGDGAIAVTRSKQLRQVKRHFVLELPPQTPPIRFRLTRSTSPEYGGSSEYFYESHSCPTNWLSDIDLIEFEGDQDPHGVIRFVNQFDATPESLDDQGTKPSLMLVDDVSTGEWR